MSKKAEVRKANKISFSIFVLALFVVLFRFIDPPKYTGDTILGSATQVVQMFPKGSPSYLRVVLELENGELITKNMPLKSAIRVGQKINIKIYKREYSGFSTYR